jgi:pimeloyl-ACP methyl ester carboxylesterase
VTCPGHAEIGRCRMASVSGVPIHTIDESGDRAIVLVHGGQSWAYTWRHQIQPFSAIGHRVIAPDLPGCGYSSLNVNDPSIAGLSRFLTDLLDVLEIEDAFFVASSGGGLPVLDLAIRQPQRVRGLVLSSTCGVPHRLPWLWRQVARPVVGEAAVLMLTRPFLGRTLRGAVHDGATITEEVVEQYYRPLHRTGAWAAQLRLERASHPSWVEEHLGEVRAPALLIWGENDPWHPHEMTAEFQRRLRRSELRVIPGCGHLPHEEQPDTFNAAALAFIDRHAA